MAETGTVVAIESNTMTTRLAPSRRNSRRLRLMCGLSAIAFIASLALPITIDTTSMTPGFKSALAVGGGNGNGNGNGDGQGKGKGNGKGQGDENGGGQKPPKGGDDDDDDDDSDDDDHGGSGGSGSAVAS